MRIFFFRSTIMHNLSFLIASKKRSHEAGTLNPTKTLVSVAYSTKGEKCLERPVANILPKTCKHI